MNALTRFLLGVNWPLLFIIAYIILIIIITVRTNKKVANLGLKLQNCTDDPQKIIAYTNQYIKKHPLSPANSTLRLLITPYLTDPEKRNELKMCVKKIRAMDIYPAAADGVLMILFLLKEYGYHEEYILLKSKIEKDFKPFQSNPYHILMQENMDIESLPKDISAVCSDQVRAIIAYYRGESYFQKGEKESASEQFEYAVQVMPQISNLLKGKGYAE